MSIELVAKAKKTKVGGDSTAKLLLICLADYADDEGMAWPGVKTMSAEVEKSDRVIQRALNRLQELGLIAPGDTKRVARIPEYQRPNVWHILPEGAAKAKTRSAKSRKPVRSTRRPGDVYDTTPGDVYDTTPGDVYDTTPVTPTTPPRCRTRRLPGDAHVTQTVIEPPYEPSCESTRARKTENQTPNEADRRRRALADLQPDDTHRALADRLGLDLDAETDKFRDRCLADGTLPADPAAALRNWLRRGGELGLGRTTHTDGERHPATDPASDSTPSRRHRHSYACDHTLALLGRSHADAQPDEPAVRAAGMLNAGVPDVEILQSLGLGGADDLDQIA